MKIMNKKVLSGLIIGATILSTGAIAMAANTGTATGSNSDSQSRPAYADKMHKGGDAKKGGIKTNIEDNLKALVSAGIITQDESDKILALSNQESQTRQAEIDKIKSMSNEERKTYLASLKDSTAGKKGDIFTQAVTNGIITQEKADAAKAKLEETRNTEKQTSIKADLSSLVTAGTITQEQADKITAYVSTLETNKPARGTKTEDTQKVEKTNPLSALVDDGTLTQEQLDAVSKALPMGGGHGHGGRGMDKASKTAATADSSTTVQ